MSGMFRYRSGEWVYAYRVQELPCEFHVKNGVEIGDWAVLNQDGTLQSYMKNDLFLQVFVPDQKDDKAQIAYANASFEKSLPGG